MNDSFQYADIILLAFIAAFVALRLRAMLGKSNGIDPREVWKQATRDGMPEKVVAFPDRAVKKSAPEEDVIPEQLQANKEVSDGLRAVRAVDQNFSTIEFLSGAKLAFEWVIQAFAKGEKEKLRTLLSEERFAHFAADIDARAQDEITHETTLVSVLATDITEVTMAGAKAQITVQFTSEQIHVDRDKDKNVVSGDPSSIEKVIDVWTFERDTTSRDPNWKITAT
jgi:predicted lipid-binding transport protein (Tim44 family)